MGRATEAAGGPAAGGPAAGTAREHGMDELRITGGRVIDPATGLDAVTDVAVAGGRIRAVGALDDTPAREVVDATGLLVTPGLIDMHTHVAGGSTFWGLDPDPIAWYSGVTTWIDAGSVGAFGLAAMLEAHATSRSRIGVLLHIAAHGLSARTGEARDMANLDAEAALTAISRHRDVVHGIKVRMDSLATGDNHLEPLRVALRVGEAAGVPVMVHIGRGTYTLDEVVGMLRPGDIITHCSGQAARGITEPGPVRDALHAAYERGVVFDVGHGAGGFKYEVVESYLAQNMPPHVVSSDLHVLCASGPAFDLPTVMAKLMAVGMTLEQVVAATTATPAAVLGLDVGTLAPGSPADIALFRLVEDDGVLGDVHGTTRTARTRLRNVATYVAGRELPPAFPQAPPSWVPLSDAQRTALAGRARALRDMLSAPLVEPHQVRNQIPGADNAAKRP